MNYQNNTPNNLITSIAAMLFVLFNVICSAQIGEYCAEDYRGYVTNGQCEFTNSNPVDPVPYAYKLPVLSVENIYRLLNLRTVDWKLNINEWSNFNDGPIPECSDGKCTQRIYFFRGYVDPMKGGTKNYFFEQIKEESAYTIMTTFSDPILEFQSSLSDYYCGEHDAGASVYKMTINDLSLTYYFFSRTKSSYGFTVYAQPN